MSEFEWIDTFGDNLRSLLDDYNMSQKELAEVAGISEASISNYIQKKRMPSVAAVINIAYAFDCDVSELIDFGDRIEE